MPVSQTIFRKLRWTGPRRVGLPAFLRERIDCSEVSKPCLIPNTTEGNAQISSELAREAGSSEAEIVVAACYPLASCC
jgi:hypothetical protein